MIRCEDFFFFISYLWNDHFNRNEILYELIYIVYITGRRGGGGVRGGVVDGGGDGKGMAIVSDLLITIRYLNKYSV